MDKVVGLTGIGVCLVAAITFSIVLNARGVNRQVETFAQVGENLSQIAVADESTFLAVADGHLAVFRILVDLLDQLLTALLRQLGEAQAQGLTVILGIDAQVGILDRLLNGF